MSCGHIMYCHMFEINSYEFTAIEKEGRLTSLFFGKKMPDKAKNEQTPILLEAEKQLREYFQGQRKEFELAIEPEGTPFQTEVWKALQTIPYGETRTYQDIAVQIGNEKACRAVGMANNKNPIAIVVPCHRVIGKNGKLTGYAGGLDIKEALLKLESK